jgi:hypothetical protein
MNPLVLVVIPSLGLHFRMERERPLRHRAKLQLSAAHAYGESFVQMRGFSTALRHKQRTTVRSRHV